MQKAVSPSVARCRCHPPLLVVVEVVASIAPDFRVVASASGWLRPAQKPAGLPESYAAASEVVGVVRQNAIHREALCNQQHFEGEKLRMAPVCLGRNNVTAESSQATAWFLVWKCR